MDSVIEMDEDSTINSPTRKIVNSLLEEIRGVVCQHSDVPYEPSSSIHKVRHFLLEGYVDIDSIAPKLVSIGPYHHETPNLKVMERAKLKYLADLARRAPSNNPEKYIKIIEQSAPEAMAKYSTPCQLDHEDFVKMMVVDGCFIVEFLLKWIFNDRRSQVGSIMTKLTVFKNDLLLVENQIPYFILEELFNASNIPGLDKSDVSFTEIALTFFMGVQTYPQFTAEKFSKDGVQFDHLLHLYHTTLNSYSDRNFTSVIKGIKITNIFTLALRVVLLFIYLHAMLKFMDTNSQRPRWIPLGVPNASNLRDSGFNFHIKKDMDFNFMDISGHGRKIKIPVLIMNESTLTNFQNLIAFEDCSKKYGKNFTAYAMLLHYLIDSAEDVAILKESGIIDNRLRDDQMVADFFNNLCSGIDLGQEKHYLSPLFEYVSNYYRSGSRYMVKFYWWRKKYIPDYFTNPWAIPSMIAASILLAMTFIQTFYTVYPYYHPRSNG